MGWISRLKVVSGYEFLNEFVGFWIEGGDQFKGGEEFLAE
jgi:hypothetical protein